MYNMHCLILSSHFDMHYSIIFSACLQLHMQSKLTEICFPKASVGFHTKLHFHFHRGIYFRNLLQGLTRWLLKNCFRWIFANSTKFLLTTATNSCIISPLGFLFALCRNALMIGEVVLHPVLCCSFFFNSCFK